MTRPFSISRMQENEINALFAFREQNFPNNSKQMDQRRWRWLYLQNPQTAGSLPVWLIKSEGEIVGSIAAVPTRVQIGKESWCASFGTDYYVHRNYLGLPALRLLKTMLAESPLNVGANLSDSARRLFGKLGYTDLGARLVKLRTSIPSCARRSRLAALRGGASEGLRRLILPLFGDIEVSRELPASWQDLWEKISPSLEVSVIKDARYLTWRYQQSPTSDYRFILLGRNGVLRSLAVVGTVDRQAGGRHGIILELLTRPGDVASACGVIHGCLDYFAGQGCQTCETHLSEGWLRRCFSWMGFSKEPSPLGLMVLTSGDSGELHRTRNPGCWAFALGDTDRY